MNGTEKCRTVMFKQKKLILCLSNDFRLKISSSQDDGSFYSSLDAS